MGDEDVLNRLARLETRVDELTTATNDGKLWQATYGEKISNIQTEMARLVKLVEDISGKPQKRWDAVIAAIISAVVVSIAAYFTSGAVT